MNLQLSKKYFVKFKGETTRRQLIQSALLILLWCGVLFPLMAISPTHFPDTPGYLANPKQLEGYFSITGNAIRGWPTVLAYWLVNSDWQRTFLQSVLYAVSWSVLLIAWIRKKSVLQTFIFGGLLVSFALTPRVLQWNMFLLSESISVSLVVFGSAFFKLSIDYAKNFNSQKKFIYLVLATSFFSIAAVNRASLVPLTLLAPIIFLIYIFKIDKTKILSYFGLLFSVLAIIYPILYNNQTNNFWSSENTRLSRSSFYFIYNTIYESLQPEWGDMLWEFVEDRAPRCLEGYRASGVDPTKNPYYLADLMAINCPSAVKWLNANFDSLFVEFFINRPVPAVSYATEMIGMVQDPLDYPATTILPKAFSNLFDSTYSHGQSRKPIYAWLTIAPLMVFASLIFRKKLNIEIVLAALLFGLGLLSLILTQFVIVSEPVRITTPATVILLSSSILLISEISTHFKQKTKESNFE